MRTIGWRARISNEIKQNWRKFTIGRWQACRILALFDRSIQVPWEKCACRKEKEQWISAVGRLLLIDHSLNEKTIQSICQGLDQLFSIVKTYVGLPRIPMFGLLVNGHNQSEVCAYRIFSPWTVSVLVRTSDFSSTVFYAWQSNGITGGTVQTPVTRSKMVSQIESHWCTFLVEFGSAAGASRSEEPHFQESWFPSEFFLYRRRVASITSLTHRLIIARYKLWSWPTN